MVESITKPKNAFQSIPQLFTDEKTSSKRYMIVNWYE